MWGGNPARYIRNATDEEKEDALLNAELNYGLGQKHKHEFYLHRSNLHHDANKVRRDLNLAIPA